MNFFKLFFKYFFQIIFSPRPFLIDIKGTKLLLPPHSLDILIPAETFLDHNYVPLFKLAGKPKIIVDLGTHIGDFTIWADQHYHPKKIIGVEMEKSIFTLYQKNLALNDCGTNIIAINKAVYKSGPKQIRVQKNSFLTAASSITKSANGKMVDTISLEEIHKLCLGKIIDYLKIDIEGAEKFLLTDKYHSFFKHQVRFVAIECHPTSGISSQNIERYFKKLGYRTKFQKITRLNILNKLLHAQNTNL